MKVSAKEVKKLRDLTGAGMMDCKKALVEAEGNIEAAVDILRKKGQKIMGKRADRNATEGAVIALTNEEGTRGVVIHLSSETDFVAKNDEFVELATGIAATAIKHFPATKEELNALSYDLDFDDDITVAKATLSMAGVIGEKIEVKKYERLEAAQVVAYIHSGNKMSVLIGMTKSSDELAAAGRNMAMQIAALAPIAVDKEDLDQSAVDKEIALQLEITTKEMPDKPAKMIENIVRGRVNKSFFKEKTLMNQPYVKDSKSTVKAYLASVDKGAKVTSFIRMTLS